GGRGGPPVGAERRGVEGGGRRGGPAEKGEPPPGEPPRFTNGSPRVTRGVLPEIVARVRRVPGEETGALVQYVLVVLLDRRNRHQTPPPNARRAVRQRGTRAEKLSAEPTGCPPMPRDSWRPGGPGGAPPHQVARPTRPGTASV